MGEDVSKPLTWQRSNIESILEFKNKTKKQWTYLIGKVPKKRVDQKVKWSIKSENIFSITSQNGNTNHNHNQLSPIPIRTVATHKAEQKGVEKGGPRQFCWEYWWTEKNMKISLKTRNAPAIWHSNSVTKHIYETGAYCIPDTCSAVFIAVLLTSAHRVHHGIHYHKTTYTQAIGFWHV